MDQHGGFQVRNVVLAASLGFLLVGPQAQTQSGQQGIPDAPRPQTTLPTLTPAAAGLATSSTSDGDPTAPTAAPSPSAAQTPEAPDSESQVSNESLHEFTLHVQANFVEIPSPSRTPRVSSCPA
jgi:hypothetical protein